MILHATELLLSKSNDQLQQISPTRNEAYQDPSVFFAQSGTKLGPSTCMLSLLHQSSCIYHCLSSMGNAGPPATHHVLHWYRLALKKYIKTRASANSSRGCGCMLPRCSLQHAPSHLASRRLARCLLCAGHGGSMLSSTSVDAVKVFEGKLINFWEVKSSSKVKGLAL